MGRIFAASLLLGVCFHAVSAETSLRQVEARVRKTPGGPQIFVDGKAVPPRFFWGNGGSKALKLASDWKKYSFSYEIKEPVSQGTLHFRFEHKNGTVWLRALRLTADGVPLWLDDSFADEKTFRRHWSVWPEEGPLGKVTMDEGGIRVRLSAPPKGFPGRKADFHLHSVRKPLKKGTVCRLTFEARGEETDHLLPCLYMVSKEGRHTAITTDDTSTLLSQARLATAAGVNLVSFMTPICWAEDGREDWTPLDRICRGLIRVNPRVLLVPRVYVDPPAWWMEKHPDLRMTLEDGTHPDNRASVSSRLYRREACAYLDRLVRHLCTAFPDRFAGVHPCGQNTGEWFYVKSWSLMNGYDVSTQQAFRDWLTAHGVPDAASANVPSREERRAVLGDVRLLDPIRQQRVIRFNRFQQEEMADFVAEMAAVCRRASEGRKLVLFFYGYAFEFSAIGYGPSGSGHYAMQRLLDRAAPNLDILCSPISYTDREWIGSSPAMSAAETVMRNGVLWLNEDDSRTFLDLRKQAHVQEGGLVNLEQSRQVLLRNTAQAALRGFGCWWMDLPGRGWFDSPDLWSVMRALAPVDAACAHRSAPFEPEVAAILDEENMVNVSCDGAAFLRPLIYSGRGGLARCGAPYGQYLLSDHLRRPVSAKLQIFLAAWRLTPEQKARLAALRTLQPGVVRVWCAAPGLSSVSAAGGDVWARGDDGKPTVVVRRDGAGWEVESAAPCLTPQLLNRLVRLAGAHSWLEADQIGKAVVWATDGFVSVQAMTEDVLRLDFGSAGKISDALTGAPVGNGPRLSIPFKTGEVRVFSVR